MAKVVLNVTLAVEVETGIINSSDIDMEDVANIVDNLSFKVEEVTKDVKVKNTSVVEFFDVPC
ncbi:MAG: hypothetical protein J6Y78_06145 [Paludibacteraceae bacterium]|nr:hypothetical protein [Paludibacteraceae bacterium]